MKQILINFLQALIRFLSTDNEVGRQSVYLPIQVNEGAVEINGEIIGPLENVLESLRLLNYVEWDNGPVISANASEEDFRFSLALDSGNAAFLQPKKINERIIKTGEKNWCNNLSVSGFLGAVWND